MNNETLEEIVIRKYLNDENYVVRIEKEKVRDKKNNKITYKGNFIVKVYYQGIESFIVKNNKLFLNTAMFTIKGNKSFSPVTNDDITYLKEKGFKFQIGFKSSGKIRQDTNKKYYLKIEPSNNIELYNGNIKKINEEMQEMLEIVKKYKKDAVHLEDANHTNYFLFDNNEIEYDKLIDLTKKLINKTTKNESIHKIECNERIVSPENINEKDLKKINKILEKKQKEYNKADKKLYGEKVFQQNLMVEMNKAKSGKDRSILKKEPFNENTHPFLMEYNFYEASIIEKKRESKKGRVDNLFIKDNKILFVELKYDEKVIGGSHGIHRHLIDIYNSSKKNKKFREEIFDDVKIYNEGLKKYNKDYKKYQIAVKKENFDQNIEFAIICGYSNGKKEIVKQKIDEIKNKTFIDLVNSHEIQKSEYEKQKKALGKKDERLLNMTVIALIKEMKHIDGFKCDVSLYLSDENYKNIEKVSI